MFSIDQVEIENFKSFRGKHKLSFPTKSGLYFITGENLHKPRRGANGTGKSTLLDSIHWCLYGKTSRGLKAANVITRGQKSCIVTTTLAVADQKYVVRRSQAPNSLTLDGQPVDQTALEAKIRLNQQSFVYSVMKPQFGRPFLEKLPSEKLTLFSEIMALNFWLEKSAEADEIAKSIELEKQPFENKLAVHKGQLITIKEDIKELRQQEQQFDKQQQQEVAKLKTVMREARQSCLMLADKLTEVLLTTETISKLAAKYSKQVDDLKAAVKSIEQELNKLDTRKALKAAEVNDLQESITNLQSVGALCPTCRQKVSKDHLQAEVAKFERTLTANADVFASLKIKGKSLGASEAKLRQELKLAEDNLREAISNSFKHERNIDFLKGQQHALEKQVEALKVNIANEQKRSNPYAISASAKLKAKQLAEAAITQIKAQTDNLNAEHAAIHPWVNGFKRIRLFIIDETLRKLELEVNNCLASLGLDDWSIEFDVERETKSGNISKGFSVLVKAPDTKDPVPFEAWSGGETQSLSLAGDLGLANLITEQAGLTNTIEFYDEPSKHLSQEALADLAETLHARAVEYDKRIFIVDHSLFDYPFDGRILITKTKEGSSISTT